MDLVANKPRRNLDEEQDEMQMMQQGSLRDRIWEANANDRKLILNGEINDSLIETIVMTIMQINEVDDANEAAIKNYVREPIKLFINSAGGDITSAMSVISAILASKTDVWTIAMGKAYSAGFLILISGHFRYAQLFSDAMYHQRASGIVAKFMDLYEYSDYLDYLDQKVQRFVLEHTMISEEDLEECHVRKKDWYMDVQELLENGCIDGIYPPEVYQCQSDAFDDEEVEEEAISE